MENTRSTLPGIGLSLTFRGSGMPLLTYSGLSPYPGLLVLLTFSNEVNKGSLVPPLEEA